MIDEVRLVVPARPTYLRLAVETGATLAARCAYRHDEIDAVRSAVENAFLAHLGPDGSGGNGALAVVYRLDPAALTGGAPGPPALEISVEPA